MTHKKPNQIKASRKPKRTQKGGALLPLFPEFRPNIEECLEIEAHLFKKGRLGEIVHKTLCAKCRTLIIGTAQYELTTGEFTHVRCPQTPKTQKRLARLLKEAEDV